jgi:predicted ATPase
LLPAEVLASLASLHPAWGTASPSTQTPTEQAGRQFYNALRALGATLSQLAPLLVVMDDVQWASPALWESLKALAHGLTNTAAC